MHLRSVRRSQGCVTSTFEGVAQLHTCGSPERLCTEFVAFGVRRSRHASAQPGESSICTVHGHQLLRYFSVIKYMSLMASWPAPPILSTYLFPSLIYLAFRWPRTRENRSFQLRTRWFDCSQVSAYIRLCGCSWFVCVFVRLLVCMPFVSVRLRACVNYVSSVYYIGGSPRWCLCMWLCLRACVSACLHVCMFTFCMFLHHYQAA